MNKKIIIGIIVSVVVLGAIIAVAIIMKPNQNPQTQPISTPSQQPTTPTTASPQQTQTSEYIVIQTDKGGVTVKNFYKIAVKIWEGGQYLIKEKGDYGLYYYQQSGRFEIGISSRSKSDFYIKKSIAEQDLINTLGVTEAEACKLLVTIGSTNIGDESIDGQIFPLSFCQ